MGLWNVAEGAWLSAIGELHHAFNVWRRLGEVAVGTRLDDTQDVDGVRAHAPLGPELHGVVGLRRECPWRLVPKVRRRSLRRGPWSAPRMIARSRMRVGDEQSVSNASLS